MIPQAAFNCAHVMGVHVGESMGVSAPASKAGVDSEEENAGPEHPQTMTMERVHANRMGLSIASMMREGGPLGGEVGRNRMGNMCAT